MLSHCPALLSPCSQCYSLLLLYFGQINDDDDDEEVLVHTYVTCEKELRSV